MSFEILDCSSIASGRANEDCAGAKGLFAWVFDGATDVLETPLLNGPSDAAWFAATLDRLMGQIADGFAGPLADLPPHLAVLAGAELLRHARRPPQSRGEHPSASGIVVRGRPGGLDYVALGDCTMIARSSRGVEVIGVEEMRTGDDWVKEKIRAIQAKEPSAGMRETRERLWPVLRAKRATMNEDQGYAIFSITAPPPHRIVTGHAALKPGSPVLIATDGLTRLVDVFGTHTAETLLDQALSRGVAALIAELREMENTDADCRRFPRAKTSDDATGLLLRVSG